MRRAGRVSRRERRDGGTNVDDPVRQIAGREVREVAVSLRCLLKERSRDEQRSLLRRIVVTGDAGELLAMPAERLTVK